MHIQVLPDPEIEPTSFSQASKFDHWRRAMGLEFDALQHSGTWSLVPPSLSMNVLPSKWVFRIKRKSDGSIERYKARLVANGFYQQSGVDFQETFSPVVKHTTNRVILALAVNFGWPIKQLDVQNAFLHGFITEKVFMRQPQGFIDPNYPNHVCRLHRSLYGHRQSPRVWHKRFSGYLEEIGFTMAQAYHSLFLFRHGNIFLVLLIYVDDILITGNNSGAMSHLIVDLSQKFRMKDLGDLKFFLGLEISRNHSGLLLTQQKYILDLLKKTGFLDSKPVSTPVQSGQQLSLYDGEPFSDPPTYRSVVGALQYLTISRPDMVFAVNQVFQFMHQPSTIH